MTRAALIILLALLLTGCAALSSPEQTAVQNASPVVVAQANAITMQALSDLEDRIYARIERANRPDTFWLPLMLALFGIVGPLAVGMYVAYRVYRKPAGNTINVLVVHQSPRGHWVAADDGRHTLESSQDVTDIIKAITRQDVTK